MGVFNDACLHQMVLAARYIAIDGMENLQEKNDNLPAADSDASLLFRVVEAIKIKRALRESLEYRLLSATLLVFSLALLPFSVYLFLSQWKTSGAYYFIETALENTDVFLATWQNFSLSVAESFPVMPSVAVLVNLVLILTAAVLCCNKKIIHRVLGASS